MWNWRAIKTGVLGPLDAPMLALQNELQLSAKTMPALARVKTTDATVTTLHTIPIPVDTVVVIHGFVVARRTGGTSGAANDGAGYELKLVANNSAGTAAEIAAETKTVLGESQAGWDVATDASGGNIRVRVTGAADNDIEWRWTGRSFSVKE